MANKSLYAKMEETVRAHIAATNPRAPRSNEFDVDALRKHFHPDARKVLGHNYFVSTRPDLQGEKNKDETVAQMTMMGSRLKTWELRITDCSIDVEKRTVVLRLEIRMVPKCGEEMLQDFVYWIVMDESGEQILKVTEFLDALAAVGIRKQMMEGAK